MTAMISAPSPRVRANDRPAACWPVVRACGGGTRTGGWRVTCCGGPGVVIGRPGRVAARGGRGRGPDRSGPASTGRPERARDAGPPGSGACRGQAPVCPVIDPEHERPGARGDRSGRDGACPDGSRPAACGSTRWWRAAEQPAAPASSAPLSRPAADRGHGRSDPVPARKPTAARPLPGSGRTDARSRIPGERNMTRNGRWRGGSGAGGGLLVNTPPVPSPTCAGCAGRADGEQM
jgi:hypothetical protein